MILIIIIILVVIAFAVWYYAVGYNQLFVPPLQSFIDVRFQSGSRIYLISAKQLQNHAPAYLAVNQLNQNSAYFYFEDFPTSNAIWLWNQQIDQCFDLMNAQTLPKPCPTNYITGQGPYEFVCIDNCANVNGTSPDNLSFDFCLYCAGTNKEPGAQSTTYTSVYLRNFAFQNFTINNFNSFVGNSSAYYQLQRTDEATPWPMWPVTIPLTAFTPDYSIPFDYYLAFTNKPTAGISPATGYTSYFGSNINAFDSSIMNAENQSPNAVYYLKLVDV